MPASKKQVIKRIYYDMTNFQKAAVFSLSILLGACVESTEDDVTTINEFSSTSSAGLNDSSVVIDPAIDDGAFNIQWNISSSDPYHIELYLSEDAQLSKSSDVNFFGQNCSSSSTIFNCSSVGDFDCRFTSENKISCGTISPANKEHNVTTFMTTLPKEAFIIIEACNGLFDSCAESASSVVFQ